MHKISSPLSRSIVLILTCCIAPVPLSADTGPLGFGSPIITAELESDRPDITEGTHTISKGHLQFEGGYRFLYEKEQGQRLRSHSLPEALLRLGILEDLELRLAWLGYVHDEVSSTGAERTEEGLADVVLGFKHLMYEQTPLHPSLSFLLETSVPTGDEEFGSEQLEPSFKLLWAYGLENGIGVAGNINFDFPYEDDTRYYQQGVSFVLSYGMELLSWYIEYYGEFPSAEAPDSSARHQGNTGITYSVTSDFQLDAYVGTGLNDEAPDFVSGLGFAIRH